VTCLRFAWQEDVGRDRPSGARSLHLDEVRLARIECDVDRIELYQRVQRRAGDADKSADRSLVSTEAPAERRPDFRVTEIELGRSDCDASTQKVRSVNARRLQEGTYFWRGVDMNYPQKGATHSPQAQVPGRWAVPARPRWRS
jgi:hypothetical protein